MIGPSSAVAADVREREQISAKTAAKVRAILHMDPFSSRRHRHILISYIAARQMQTRQRHQLRPAWAQACTSNRGVRW